MSIDAAAWDHENSAMAFLRSEECRQRCEKTARDYKRRCEIDANAIYPLAGMDTVKRALQVFDPREKHPDEHKVWDDLVDIFQLHDIPWMDKQQKASVCRTKLYRSMREILHQLGYVVCCDDDQLGLLTSLGARSRSEATKKPANT